MVGPVSQVYDYTYKTDSTYTLEKITTDGYSFAPKTDILGRNAGREISNLNDKILGEYIYYRKVGDHATNMPSSVYFGNIKNGKYAISDNIKYEYDNSGNIISITENGKFIVGYTYDKLNRLVREDNKGFGKTYIYSYDNMGNILSRRECAYTLKREKEIEYTVEKVYTYDGDKLLSYGNELFEYDDIGNPTTYRGKTVEWTKGRQMTKYNGITFAYDGFGRRTSKGNITYTYDSNNRIIKQSNGIEFIYDNSGVVGFTYNSIIYLYQKDVLGNICKIIDSSGNVVVQYKYDAWGNHAVLDANGADITDETHVGYLNPFRYRSYYYDADLGLYYLKLRYYDAEIGRFITIDDTSYLDPDTINGLNLYAYCGNNPVMRVDPNGTFFWFIFIGAIIIGAVIGAVSGGVSAVQNGQSFWKGTLIGALTGAVTGAALGLGGALGAAAFVAGTSIIVVTALMALGGTLAASFVAGIGIYALETHLYGEEFQWDDALISGGFLAFESALNFGIGLLLGAKGYWPQNEQVYKGIINKIVGTIKFMVSNVKTIIERTYLKTIFTFPITFIMDRIKGELF